MLTTVVKGHKLVNTTSGFLRSSIIDGHLVLHLLQKYKTCATSEGEVILPSIFTDHPNFMSSILYLTVFSIFILIAHIDATLCIKSDTYLHSDGFFVLSFSCFGMYLKPGPFLNTSVYSVFSSI